MTLVKTDRPRRIDRAIDYFGEPRPGMASDPSLHVAAAGGSFGHAEEPWYRWEAQTV